MADETTLEQTNWTHKDFCETDASTAYSLTSPGYAFVRLPRVRGSPGGKGVMGLRRLCWVVQKYVSFEDIRFHVEEILPSTTHPSPEELQIWASVAMFFGVARNCIQTVDLLFSKGVDPNKYTFDGVPLLAFAIMHSLTHKTNTTEIVRRILLHGANPYRIPQYLWKDFLQQPDRLTNLPLHHTAPKDPGWGSETPMHQCTYRIALAMSLHLSQRHLLSQASKVVTTSQTIELPGKAADLMGIFKLPLFLVGQDYAIKCVTECMLEYAKTLQSRKLPMSIVFAGPASHGKRTLTFTMARLMKLPQFTVDCTKSVHPWYKQMLNLNEFLAHCDGTPGIVLVDRFDQLDEHKRRTILTKLELGTSHDFQRNTRVDISKTIWLFTTHAVDELIVKFHKRFLVDDGSRRWSAESAPAAASRGPDVQNSFWRQSQLVGLLRASLLALHTGPLILPTATIIPFFPFSTSDTAVLFHKFLLECFDSMRLPSSSSPLPPTNEPATSPPPSSSSSSFLEHSAISIAKDGTFCKVLANRVYNVAAGAQSLRHGAEELRNPIADFLSKETEVDDGFEEDLKGRHHRSPMEPNTEVVHEFSVHLDCSSQGAWFSSEGDTWVCKEPHRCV